ncbi:MAG TPA: lytic transglycosylase domain-containing protein [Candidatus Aquilonibacter sp.]|nr:lytic transglycosylase domain-containing protein [Candidatus Aquilonibacter sp.]
MAILVLAASWALPCHGAESAVLRNGFAIRHERRVVMGVVTRLYITADGKSYVDIPTVDIDHFEAAPDQSASLSREQPPAASSVHARTAHARLSPAELDELVSASSVRYRLDPDLVNSVIKAESGFNVRAVSRKGAQGLMQLMPETAMKLGVPDAFDAQANVEGGTRYLRALLERYHFDLVKALAAYNAGPQRVEQFGGVPPYYETKAYVARIVRDFNKKKAAQQAAASSRKGTVRNTYPAASAAAKSAHPQVQSKANSLGN